MPTQTFVDNRVFKKKPTNVIIRLNRIFEQPNIWVPILISLRQFNWVKSELEYELQDPTAVTTAFRFSARPFLSTTKRRGNRNKLNKGICYSLPSGIA